MSRRRWVLCGACLLAALAAGYVAWLVWPQPEPAIGPTNYSKLRLGMTQAEVEAVIGMPRRGSYFRSDVPVCLWPTWDVRAESGVTVWADSRSIRKHARWEGEGFTIFVVFDSSGSAVGLALWEHKGQAGPWERLRTRLGW